MTIQMKSQYPLGADRPPLLSLDVQSLGTTAHLALAGELDTVSVPMLNEAIDKSLAQHNSVALDLDAVTFIDSAGLGALIRGFKAAEAAGGSLRVARASAPVARLLELTGQAERFLAAT